MVIVKEIFALNLTVMIPVHVQQEKYVIKINVANLKIVPQGFVVEREFVGNLRVHVTIDIAVLANQIQENVVTMEIVLTLIYVTVLPPIFYQQVGVNFVPKIQLPAYQHVQNVILLIQ